MNLRVLLRPLTCIISFLVLSNSALANVFLTFSPGAAFEKNGTTQTVLIETTPQSISNKYIANNDWHTAYTTELGLAMDLYRNSPYDVRIGVSAAYIGNIQLTGINQQFAQPDFDTLNYKYKINSYTAMGTAKLLYTVNKKWHPYVNARLGYANNVSYDYEESPRIAGAVPMPAFSSHGSNSFAYGFGLGMMMRLNSKFSVGLGYQFEDLGYAELGRSSTQTSNDTPSLQHIYLNEVLLNLSYKLSDKL